MNDIVTVVKPGTQIRLFADDCVVFRTIKSMDDQKELNSSLNNIFLWCEEWGMAANVDKTVSLRITHKKNPLEYAYKMGSVPLKQVESYKYLGVTFTNNFSWNLHIDNTCSSAFRKLTYLRHKLRNAPSNVKLLTYLTYIRPKLEYACVAWDPYTKVNVNKLERIQRKSVRFIYSKFKRSDSPSELMLANDIPLLEQRRRKHRLDFLHNLIT